MAAAAQLTIVQTQHIAGLGELSPEEIATPGLYVDRLVHVAAGDPPLKT
jgi:acyl CoA:acetate/3-ketoacid CoA transferase alpha subunit